MGSKDARVDAYIAAAAPLARPILTHLRRVVHAGCPAVVETIKWGHPYFEHKGVLCSMAAFRAHSAFGFRHSEVARGAGSRTDTAAGRFGRITRLSDLPKDAELKALVREAAARNAAGANPRTAPVPTDPPPLAVPDEAALDADAKAPATSARSG